MIDDWLPHDFSPHNGRIFRLSVSTAGMDSSHHNHASSGAESPAGQDCVDELGRAKSVALENR